MDTDVHIEAYIAMGSNLGDRHAHIEGALAAMAMTKGIAMGPCSSIIETDPVGPSGQGPYLNGVVQVQTTLSARALLESLLRIESRFGRDRTIEKRWGARTLDLDVLLFGDQMIDEPGLEIPHPRLGERLFVLVPMCEIAPDLILPGYKKTPRDLLEAMESQF